MRGGGISANNLVSDFISPWYLLAQAGNLRPFKDLENENVVEPYHSGLYTYAYTKNYLVFLQQGNDDSYIYIEIYKLDTWETVLKRKMMSEYSNKSVLGGNYVALNMTYNDDVYLISNDFSSILNIRIDETQDSKYVFNLIALPRKMTDYVSVCTLGNTAYMFGFRTDSGTSSSANTTYTSIIKFDASTKAVTVLGISTADMGFNVGGQNSSNTQSSAGVYGCFPYGDNEIMIFGKHADADLKSVRMVLYNALTGVYTNVTDDPEFAYLKKLSIFSTLFSNSASQIKSARKSVASDGLVKYETTNAIYVPTGGGSSSNPRWYLDTSNSAYIYLRENIVIDTKEKKLYSTWVPRLTSASIYKSGSYSSPRDGMSYSWIGVNDTFQQVPSGASINAIDISRSLVYNMDRKSIKAFSMDTTDSKLRAVGAMMIDFVAVVKKGVQVKPFSEIPSPMQVRFVRPSNLSIIDYESDAEGYYDVQEECYMYMAIENDRVPKVSSMPLDGYPYINEQPFKILVR
ncbi:hypothetical protein [Dielma fastidiosa]|uniref:Uncharacterized protein n=1 Tax=Dielma fastidiosa TaxID=1034346 RepID=A0A318KJ41_9FIRM|nr:hypothetical protein [Dielma fastidiosa]PXX74641.1 hypothetical protein DES51_12227 [Dielma fastidiosa]